MLVSMPSQKVYFRKSKNKEKSIMEVTIELGPDLQLEYQSWLDVKESLGIERSINNFLYYTYNYGTFANPKNPDENEE
jgi:hypothetical protein